MKLLERIKRLEQAQAQPRDKAIPIITLAPGEPMPAGMTPILIIQPGYLDLLL
jgi:hypothetical protein